MPQLLQGVIYIIETFHKYATDEGDCWTLSLEQLKQLLLGEIGDFLKPFDILTARSNLNLLARDGNETISFNEFILLIFDLLNICYQDMQSILTLEPKTESDVDKVLSGDMEACETSGYEEEAGLDQYEQRLTGTESLVKPMEKVPDTLTKEDPKDDLENPRLLGREVEYNLPKSQSQEEGDNQNQERTQQVKATGQDGVPSEEKRPPKEFVKRVCSQKDGKIVSEECEVPKKQDGTKTRDQPLEQEEEQNMEIQSVHNEEKAEKTSGSQEGAINKDDGEHAETQEPSSQENQERKSETDDLTTEKTKEKLSEIKSLPEYRDDDGTQDLHEPLIQGREYETQDILAKGDDSRDSEIEVVIDERKGKKTLENSKTIGQKENEKDNQMETLTEQEPDGKEKQLEELADEGDIRKESGTLELKSGGNQNHPEHKGPAVSEEEEITVHEISEPEFSGDNKSASVAKRTPETKDPVQELGPQDDQFRGKDGRISQTLDQPTGQHDAQKAENQNAGILSETYNNSGGEENISESRDLPTQKNCQSQEDAQEQPEQKDGNNLQESPVQGSKSRIPGTEVPIDRGDNENTTEEQEELIKEGKKLSLTETTATTEESENQSRSQESMKQKVAATFPKTEIPEPTDDGARQLSIIQQSEKEDPRKDPETHGADAEGKGEESESQEAPLEGQDSETQYLTLDSSPDTLNPREDKNSQRLAEASEKQHVGNEDDSSLGLSEQVEKKPSDTEPCSSSEIEVHSKSVYENFQKSSAEPDLPVPEEHLSQIDTFQASDPELMVEREPQRSETPESPTLLNPPCDYKQEPRQQEEDPEIDEEYDMQQETLVSQSQEDDQLQLEDEQ
ncbi:trichohyalin-like protein 1 [Macrotis lagotis]|uniref:trichohyalin-like protein 1 n=1 Tax=Macrotis lagotis TaxID=92651 RepID=UPI003D69CE20